MNYRIKNGLLLLFDGNGFSTKKEDLFISEGRIVAVGTENIDNPDKYTDVDADNQLVMPGLINSHTHAYMSFMKNFADDIPFDKWLYDRVFSVEAKMSGSDFYWTTLLGCMEMIRTGTTCYLDMHICGNECAAAANDSGLRAFIGRCITGTDLYADGKGMFESALSEESMYESDLLNFVLSPHSIYSCSEKMLSQINEEADKRNMLKHIHLSETQKELEECLVTHHKTPVEYLNDIGFLDSKTITAHCVKLNERDIDILKHCGASVATNPSSNAKLGNGAAPVVSMLQKGVNVCLGTDGSASNNTLNMFREIGVFSLIHKAKNENTTDLVVNDILKCATVNSAKALGLDKSIGIISEGAFADLIFLDLSSVSFFPNNNMVSALCYSANGSEVKSVMVNGNFVMKNGFLTTLDSERIYYEVRRIADKYI